MIISESNFFIISECITVFVPSKDFLITNLFVVSLLLFIVYIYLFVI